jgi:hypothetical protein
MYGFISILAFTNSFVSSGGSSSEDIGFIGDIFIGDKLEKPVTPLDPASPETNTDLLY